MGMRDMPGPARIFLSMLGWGVILWLFTLHNRDFIPVAKFLFIVLVIPNAIIEWLKDKNIIKAPAGFYTRLILVIGAGVIWYLFYW